MIYCLVIWHSYGQWSIYRFLLMISPINMVILHGYVKSPEGISAVHPWFLDSKNELVGPKAPKKAIQWPPGSGPPLRSVESPILDADGLNPDLHWVKHGEKSDIYDGSWNIKYRLIDENNKLNHIVFSLYHYIYYIYIILSIWYPDVWSPKASSFTRDDRWMTPYTPKLSTAYQFRRQLRQRLGLKKEMASRQHVPWTFANGRKSFWPGFGKSTGKISGKNVVTILVGDFKPWIFIFHFIHGMSSFPLTFTPSFFKKNRPSHFGWNSPKGQDMWCVRSEMERLNPSRNRWQSTGTRAPTEDCSPNM